MFIISNKMCNYSRSYDIEVHKTIVPLHQSVQPFSSLGQLPLLLWNSDSTEWCQLRCQPVLPRHTPARSRMWSTTAVLLFVFSLRQKMSHQGCLNFFIAQVISLQQSYLQKHSQYIRNTGVRPGHVESFVRQVILLQRLRWQRHSTAYIILKIHPLYLFIPVGASVAMVFCC